MNYFASKTALFAYYADQMERATSRAAADIATRDLFHAIHHDLCEKDPEAMGELSRLVKAWSIHREPDPRNTIGVRELTKVEIEAYEALIRATLLRLPLNYPDPVLTEEPEGYALNVEHTLIFSGVGLQEAYERTKRYVAAREEQPDLPIGVIDGIYD